jgi:hypothetical protein
MPKPPKSPEVLSPSVEPSVPTEAPAPVDASVDAAPPATISFAEPVVVQTAVIEDAPEVEASHGLTDEQFAAVHKEAVAENDKEDFRARILAARAPQPEPEPMKPVMSDRMLEQTKAELAAGAEMVKKNEAERLARGHTVHVPDRGEGKNTEVFRPANYIPDPKKNQGNVGARKLA